MILIVRKEISDFYEDIGENLENHILPIFQMADIKNIPVVSFSLENSTIWEVNDEEVIHYINMMNVDTKDILKVSAILSHGFILLMRGYANKIEELITGKQDGS